MTAVAQVVTITRYVRSTKAAKSARDAAKQLGAEEVVLRACGQWLNDKNETLNLADTHVPIREVKSVWIDANWQGRWIHLRPNSDPTLEGRDVPKIEIEADIPISS